MYNTNGNSGGRASQKNLVFHQWLYALAVLSTILVFISLAVLNFPGAGRDDVFITLWAGETLGKRIQPLMKY